MQLTNFERFDFGRAALERISKPVLAQTLKNGFTTLSTSQFQRTYEDLGSIQRTFTGPNNKRVAWALTEHLSSIYTRLRPDHVLQALNFFSQKRWEDANVYGVLVQRILQQEPFYSLDEITQACISISEAEIQEEKLQQIQIRLLGANNTVKGARTYLDTLSYNFIMKLHKTDLF